jgi:hypothetical protein
MKTVIMYMRFGRKEDEDEEKDEEKDEDDE